MPCKKSTYTVAIKTLKLKDKFLDEKNQAEWRKSKVDFVDELKIMKKLRHENLVKL
jgi:hypothetical protein